MDGVSTGLGVVKETRHRTAPEEVAKASSMKSQCKTSEILHTGAETCIYGHRRTLPASSLRSQPDHRLSWRVSQPSYSQPRHRLFQ
ncbi:hypothetical protein PGT21_003100 [Puccinia graminis f. sp. tritici]|uniref:Uncharacterized protein n=1 Tax=Puccinia graminis f. sp. tritici TaxID=56615 RepID=A0A5B0QEB4_PUCGR|nr:hypothetical protein PGT21_003100 [Puccinia graminis f. sp. tritici]KAA1123777.1 hypothetical protein PGTUg99_018180 [Puccinia graminis f. sp. tritici]